MNRNQIIRLLLPLLLLVAAGSVQGQELEPRSFSQTPVGMNFGVLALGYAEGGVLFDSATTLEDVTGEITSLAAGYLRTLNIFGASAKASAVIPVMWGDWEGLYQGEYATASRRGFGDPLFELSVNFIGAPAMKMSELRTYQQKWVVGASLKFSAPLGQYYPDKLINLGANRWAFRPRIGASYKSGPWSFEAMGSVWLFTKNDDFFGGNELEQEPQWALQFNAVYQWPSRVWVGAGIGLARGGQARTNGIESDSYKKNTRWAALVAVPIGRRNSVKVIYIDGLSTRIGADFNQISLAWNYRWGGMN